MHILTRLVTHDFRKRAWRTELMQWRKHVRIKYGGRVGVGQGQREREQGQLQVRVVQLQREGGARLSYVCHQPQLSSTARRSCSAAAMLCCGRRKVSAVERTIDIRTDHGKRRWYPSGTRESWISLRESLPLPFMRELRIRNLIDRLEVSEIFQVDSVKTGQVYNFVCKCVCKIKFRSMDSSQIRRHQSFRWSSWIHPRVIHWLGKDHASEPCSGFE